MQIRDLEIRGDRRFGSIRVTNTVVETNIAGNKFLFKLITLPFLPPDFFPPVNLLSLIRKSEENLPVGRNNNSF